MNNAVGTEKLEDVYGGKERLAKLRRLKQKWDPKKVYGYEDFTA